MCKYIYYIYPIYVVPNHLFTQNVSQMSVAPTLCCPTMIAQTSVTQMVCRPNVSTPVIWDRPWDIGSVWLCLRNTQWLVHIYRCVSCINHYTISVILQSVLVTTKVDGPLSVGVEII